MLQAIGLSDLEERVYLALLRGSGESDLASRSGVSPVELRAALDRLAGKRLLRRPAGTGRYEPVPPRIALPALVAESAEVVRRSKRAADELLSGFLRGLDTGPADVAEAVSAGQAAPRLREMLDYAVEEVLVADDGVSALPLETGGLAGLAGRGVRLKVVCAGAGPPPWAAKLDATVRTVAAIPASFVIADGRHAAVALTSGPVAMITGPTLLMVLSEVATALWRQGPPSAEDRELLQMLAAGMKDEAIARRTGIGVRTVKRKIAELFDLLGAETRFQAGLRAYRQGLL
jgi:sugar-specific transcriptional regulator TrmB/DNA-binding CsgD family transcriptional regulator